MLLARHIVFIPFMNFSLKNNFILWYLFHIYYLDESFSFVEYALFTIVVFFSKYSGKAYVSCLVILFNVQR